MIDTGMYLEIAGQLGSVDPRLAPEWYGYRDPYPAIVLRPLPDGQEVWVTRMMLNWRVLEVVPDSCGYGRYWCYPGNGMGTFVVATRHALLYGDAEPDGWIKSWDGRVGDPRRAVRL